MTNSKFHWPNGVLVYDFDISVLARQRALVESAIAEFHEKSCVTTRRRNLFDVDYVKVTVADEGCYSNYGKGGGVQLLNLQSDGCFDKGIIIHEFLHAYGFYHMQSDSRRDSYVKILWENIKPEYKGQFDKRTSDISSFGFKYDYSSIMHYDRYAFSKNGKPTMESINPPKTPIGISNGLTDTDIGKLNAVYNC